MARRDNSLFRLKKEFDPKSAPTVFSVVLVRREKADVEKQTWENEEEVRRVTYDLADLPDENRARLTLQGAATVMTALQSEYGKESRGEDPSRKLDRMDINWEEMVAGRWGMPSQPREKRMPARLLQACVMVFGETLPAHLNPSAYMEAVWQASTEESRRKLQADERVQEALKKIAEEKVDVDQDALNALLSADF